MWTFEFGLWTVWMILHNQAKESQGTVPGTKGGVALTGSLLNSSGLSVGPPQQTGCSLTARCLLLCPQPCGVPLMLSGTGTLVQSICSSATHHPRADLGLCHGVVVLERAKVQQRSVQAGGRQTQCSEVIVSQDHWGEQPPKENPNCAWAEFTREVPDRD